jgi:hypothetical protein
MLSGLFFAAASLAEFFEFVPTPLTAGRAYCPALAALTSVLYSSPVTTPGFKVSDLIFFLSF